MSKTILCVDDSATMQTVCEITFRASDYDYVGARSGDEGLQKARSSSPDVVLVDAVMPDKTGYEVCEALKKELSNVPVIIMCGNSEAYDEGRGSAAGADGHVTKPWDSTKLIEQLGGILDKASSDGTARPGAAAAAPAPKPKPEPAPAPASKPLRAPTPPPIAATPPPKPAIPPKPAPPTPAPTPTPTPAVAAPPKPAVGPPPSTLPQSPAGLDRPPMIKGVPTKRPATPIAQPSRSAQAASAARSATIMGMTPVTQMPGKTSPKPPGVTSISSKQPVSQARQPEVAEQVAAKAQAAVPAAAAAAAREAGLDPSGPEMQALVKLSRDVIERVVWEVVPELAETIIRENLDRLAARK